MFVHAGCFLYLFTQPGQFDYWSGEYDDAGHFMTGSVYVREMKALPAAVELKVDDEYEADYGPGMGLYAGDNYINYGRSIWSQMIVCFKYFIASLILSWKVMSSVDTGGFMQITPWTIVFS